MSRHWQRLLLALGLVWALVPAVSAREPALPEVETKESRLAEWQAGLASWFGAAFHGRRTASGERFNMNDLTAAHRTLPFGTRVRVRNPDTNAEVVVRINDHGPNHRNRLIDLSRSAAQALGMLGRGIVKVEILPLMTTQPGPESVATTQ